MVVESGELTKEQEDRSDGRLRVPLRATYRRIGHTREGTIRYPPNRVSSLDKRHIRVWENPSNLLASPEACEKRGVDSVFPANPDLSSSLYRASLKCHDFIYDHNCGLFVAL